MVEQTAALIKSIVLSKSEGIPVEKLNDEFEIIVGEPIPYLRLGFNCLRNLLNKVDGLRSVLNSDGERILTATGPKIRHVESLIQRQKREYLKQKQGRYKRFTPYSNNDRQPTRSWRRRKTTNNRETFAARRPYQTSYENENKRTNTNRGNQVSSFEEEEEYHRPIIIECDIEETLETIYKPIACGRQLIGDDFFLQLTIKNLNQPIWRSGEKKPLHCGLCKSGQTIKDCTRALKSVNCISNRLTIMLGSVDVYNGASAEEMIEDMEELLDLLRNRFSFSNSAITLCTLPPLANISAFSHYSKVSTLYLFNNWIRSLARKQNESLNSGYHVIDFYKLFCDETYATQYDWFQRDARWVSGCRHPYVLWNKIGRKRAMDAIIGGF